MKSKATNRTLWIILFSIFIQNDDLLAENEHFKKEIHKLQAEVDEMRAILVCVSINVAMFSSLNRRKPRFNGQDQKMKIVADMYKKAKAIFLFMHI